MARRKDHTREELTHLAIEAGKELISQKGLSALTARNVAQSIGYAPGTLYNLFDNIDALTAAINIDSMNMFAETIRAHTANASTIQQKLYKLSQTYLDFHKNKPELWSLLFAVPLKYHSEDYHIAVHKIFDQVTAIMTPLSQNNDEARQKAKILWSALHGICLLEQSGKLSIGEEDSLDCLMKRLLEQFLKD